VVRGEVRYEPPVDQVRVHKLVELIYRAADEGKELRP
jgi:hypothetical protein